MEHGTPLCTSAGTAVAEAAKTGRFEQAEAATHAGALRSAIADATDSTAASTTTTTGSTAAPVAGRGGGGAGVGASGRLLRALAAARGALEATEAAASTNTRLQAALASRDSVELESAIAAAVQEEAQKQQQQQKKKQPGGGVGSGAGAGAGGSGASGSRGGMSSNALFVSAQAMLASIVAKQGAAASLKAAMIALSLSARGNMWKE